MGAYRSKPLTEKVSESGQYCSGRRRIIYGATAMQGWRVSMEDALCIVPEFDGGSSLFGVFDGHGGREVAMYCANHLGDMIKATAAYNEGDLAQAMKDAFMKCDRTIKEKEAIQEMKQYDEDEIPVDEQDRHETKEELEGLFEESSMPLRDLLARYNAPIIMDPQEEGKDGLKHREGIGSILQLLRSNPDLDSEESEYDSEQESASSADESEDDAATQSPLPLSNTPSLPPPSITETPSSTPNTPTSSTSNILPSKEPTTPNNGPTNMKTPTNTSSHSTSAPLDTPADVNKSNDLAEQAITVCSPLQSLMHDSEASAESTQESTNSLEDAKSSKMDRLESRSLMELLTAKPDTSDVRLSIATRKRPHGDDESAGNPLKKSPSKAMSKQGYHSGTTAVVGILRDTDFVVANAGDSKCVFACRGKAIDMSFDHKPTDQVELDRITKAGGKVGADSRVNGGLNLSRAIGDHFYKSNPLLSLEDQMISALPDIKSIPLQDDGQKFIVFACDGIWNSKTSQEVVDFVCWRLGEKVGSETPSQEHLTQICESLCDACLAADTNNDGTGCDNMTCILIYLDTVT